MGRPITQEEIEEYKKHPDAEALNCHFSAAYLLCSLAIQHIDYGNAILRRWGLYEHQLKRCINGMNKEFDKIVFEYSRLIPNDELRTLFCADYEQYSAEFDKLLGFGEIDTIEPNKEYIVKTSYGHEVARFNNGNWTTNNGKVIDAKKVRLI